MSGVWIRLVVALLVCLARGLEAIAAADETGYDAFYATGPATVGPAR